MIVALLKTTLATHIAGELTLRGQHVILLDANPQGSSLGWTQRRIQQGLPRLFPNTPPIGTSPGWPGGRCYDR